jgi:hypothetical protein
MCGKMLMSVISGISMSVAVTSFSSLNPTGKTQPTSEASVQNTSSSSSVPGFGVGFAAGVAEGVCCQNEDNSPSRPALEDVAVFGGTSVGFVDVEGRPESPTIEEFCVAATDVPRECEVVWSKFVIVAVVTGGDAVLVATLVELPETELSDDETLAVRVEFTPDGRVIMVEPVSEPLWSVVEVFKYIGEVLRLEGCAENTAVPVVEKPAVPRIDSFRRTIRYGGAFKPLFATCAWWESS